MSGNVSRKVLAVSAGGLLVTSPLLAACTPVAAAEPAGYRDWVATDGAAGRINMDDVQAAFQESTSATDFETRVNEIYEGDGVILVRVAQETDRMVLEGWEDLDGNSDVDDVVDDLLFSIVRQDGQHEMVGHHANSYYRSSFGGGDFLFFYLLAGGLRGNNYYYQTPSQRGPVLRQQRDTYRGEFPVPGPAGVEPGLHHTSADLSGFSLPGGWSQFGDQPFLLSDGAKDHRHLPEQRFLLRWAQRFRSRGDWRGLQVFDLQGWRWFWVRRVQRWRRPPRR
ncbi:hypothetical protein GBAR_LOCUS4701 [Geodia barretti]|uniref:Uncharacterized protein n=1 Tax=Geodia barretti TaxID=519541 RepID=A0AA35R8P5_GEOBA|nr:hypothetical protein GBAR_LOCUS4701 [Geodia barretti]